MKPSIFNLSLAAFVAVLPIFTPNISVADPGFVAHEWGTFTSVQGMDGLQMEWNPWVTADLPEFVYDLNRSSDPALILQGARLSKGEIPSLQRMETPVIYFYSDQPRTVDVLVRFPEGTMTEWFPQAASLTSVGDGVSCRRPGHLAAGKQLHWPEVQVLPREDNLDLQAALPLSKSGSHYFAAREANGDYLRVQSKEADRNKVEVENYLFYRGVGQFQAPLRVSLSAADETEVQMASAPGTRLTGLFTVEVKNGRGRFQVLESLGAVGTETNIVKLSTLPFRPLGEFSSALEKELRTALVRAGLYTREASAMVETWRDSWLEEDGVRVLYLLPRAWTDQVLPLTITPAPRELVRVMIGRAELITPEVEWRTLREIARVADGSGDARARAVQSVQGLGRFAEPVIRRLTTRTPNAEFSRIAWELFREASPQRPEAVQSASKVPAPFDLNYGVFQVLGAK